MYLHKTTKPISVKNRTISNLTDAMLQTGFQGRKLAESIEIWMGMLEEKDLTIFMGLSGALVPAGMGKIISFFIKNRLIDCLVSTGANIFHDIHETLGNKHYIGSHLADDTKLFESGIDRIYDIFAVEKEFRNTDHFIANFAKKLKNKKYSSREFIYLLGKELAASADVEDSIIVSAYKHNVPIFIPALCDSSIGIGLMIAKRNGIEVVIDQISDVDEITQIVEQTKKTGVIYIGGGVPKNFIQQTEIIADILGLQVGGHDYAIQYTTDAPHWGGLSGCTFNEAISWGKISVKSSTVQVFVDATIALPIVAHALNEKIKKLGKRIKPIYIWNDRLD
ncbi:MAG: deoxyhypusine synthase [Methanosarcinales archaeon]